MLSAMDTKKRPRILIVDDEEFIREMIAEMLEPFDYEIVHAYDGVDALDKAAAKPPDVILLDVTMPRLDGFGVLKRIKEDETTRIIPVVMITALNELPLRLQAIEWGVDDFLGKPVDITELRVRVKSLLKVKAYNDHLINYQQKLEKDVAERTKEVQLALKRAKDASYETILILSRAAEYRDKDTGSHILRVSNFAAAIAKTLGNDDEYIERILYGAPLHDVGKIGIPDSILLKPGKLTTEEFETMKTHTTIGGRILERSASPFAITGGEIALSHHENWDGSGYPDALKGIQIPLSGRIVAVADVFDALTTKRPYKEPFPIDKSLEIIREWTGTHFDPDVARAFLDTLEEIMAIKERYREQATRNP